MEAIIVPTSHLVQYSLWRMTDADDDDDDDNDDDDDVCVNKMMVQQLHRQICHEISL